MADRPILFSAPMVKALLAGTKTQTRRLVMPQPAEGCDRMLGYIGIGCTKAVFADEDTGRFEARIRIEKGDRLYVREHWRTSGSLDSLPPRDIPNSAEIIFEADGFPKPEWRGRHRQAMHMPRWASRITLLVDDVKVERLQDISEEDAKAEGITRIGAEYIARGSKDWDAGPNFYTIDLPEGRNINDATAVDVYRRLWEWINGEGSWDANPWVYAVTFRTILENIDHIGRAAA